MKTRFSVNKYNRMVLSGNICNFQWYFTGANVFNDILRIESRDLSMLPNQFSLAFSLGWLGLGWGFLGFILVGRRGTTANLGRLFLSLTSAKGWKLPVILGGGAWIPAASRFPGGDGCYLWPLAKVMPMFFQHFRCGRAGSGSLVLAASHVWIFFVEVC